jgi:hypothetical protein
MHAKNLRNLLLDCRAALRRTDPAFESTPLGDLLDATIIELGQAAARPTAAAPETGSSGSRRVAYAWQAVTRELRLTHAELYASLSQKVLARLDTDVSADPAAEIAALQARVAEREAALEKTAAELSALRSALATAVPLAETVGGSEAALAQQRLQLLLQAVSTAGGVARPAPAPEAEFVPDRALLQAVAAGQRTLSSQHREWCIGEAMVLTGFQRTPVQLLEHGDAALARLVLGEAHAPHDTGQAPAA